MSSAAKLGIFMLVILAVLGYFVLKIEDVKIGRGAPLRKVTAIFDSVAGLDNKSTVRVAGVREVRSPEDEDHLGVGNHRSGGVIDQVAAGEDLDLGLGTAGRKVMAVRSGAGGNRAAGLGVLGEEPSCEGRQEKCCDDSFFHLPLPFVV